MYIQHITHTHTHTHTHTQARLLTAKVNPLKIGSNAIWATAVQTPAHYKQGYKRPSAHLNNVFFPAIDTHCSEEQLLSNNIFMLGFSQVCDSMYSLHVISTVYVYSLESHEFPICCSGISSQPLHTVNGTLLLSLLLSEFIMSEQVICCNLVHFRVSACLFFTLPEG